MSINWSRFFIVACLSFSAIMAIGQSLSIEPEINSPYSRFGLGNLNNQYFAIQGGMGGLSAAFNDPYHLNILNPASLAHLQSTALEVGLDARYTSISAGDASEGLWSGNLHYLALGFPVINPINQALDRRETKLGLGMAFSLQPYTTIGYDVEIEQDVPGAGQSTSLLQGAGQTYRLAWSNAVRYGALSGGLSLGYNWGQVRSRREVEFPELPQSYVTSFSDEFSMRGFFWRAGLQYTYLFKEADDKGVLKPTGKRLIFGVQGTAGQDFSTTGSRSAERFRTRPGGEFLRDELFNEEDVEGEGRMPSEYTFGLQYEQVNKFRLGAEAGFATWSNYTNDARPDPLIDDAWHLRFGGEIIPDHLSYNNYLKRVRYRFGAYYLQDPRRFGGQQLQDYGVSLGLGLPIILSRQRTSFVNIAVEAGRLGIDDVLTESYINMTLGFTLNDNTWFFKRKFN